MQKKEGNTEASFLFHIICDYRHPVMHCIPASS